MAEQKVSRLNIAGVPILVRHVENPIRAVRCQVLIVSLLWQLVDRWQHVNARMSEHISQHLQISSPSSTAVEFTISSRTRKSAKAVTLLRHALRLIVASYTFLATITKLQMTFSTGTNQYIDYLLQASLLNSFLRLIIDSAPWWVLSVTSLLTLYLCVKRDYTGQ